MYPKNARHEKDKDGKETGEWICSIHWHRDYNKYDPNSTDNIIKSLANCRTGNQNTNSPCANGDLDIDIVCELRQDCIIKYKEDDTVLNICVGVLVISKESGRKNMKI